MSYFSLAIGYLVYFSIHSILASTFIKKYINKLPPVFRSSYRIFFNIIAIILLLPLVFIYNHLPSEQLFGSFITIQVLAVLMMFSGIYILINSFKNYRTDEFIGTYQLKNKSDFHPSYLNRSGWNSIVRHPLYFGMILLFTGVFIFEPSIKLGITSLMLISYLYVGTFWEEKKLIMEFDEYRAYKADVSMLIPLKWVVNKIFRS